MNMITNPILTGFNPDPYRYITPVTWFTGIY